MMENKILEVLLDMQSDMKNMQSDIKNINVRLEKIEFQMKDGFETLEIINDENSVQLGKVKTKVAKLEKRINEITTVN